MARTVGSVVHTEDIVEKEVKEWAKINQKVRIMVEYQLTVFDKKIKEDGYSMEGQLQILSGLKDLLSTSVKVVESGVKLLQSAKTVEENDPEATMKDLLA